ncbi:hypothetical protein GCM10011608_36870 [Micromonospora sonchi]|uniref:Uncharacterized protein n=1 Tax=Micromonospora sonchi TaxID=1763543 RepID=A0A917X0R2_9ACTN|nr:hypothetical protein [Micromonospora sonchi]GGM48645.1 hypothetical protein GCM10011608_36870 [Micromonospora sonchi]
MNPASRRASTIRIIGNLALVAGLLVSIITLSSDTGWIEPHILAGFLVAVGIGLRIEAAISEPRA